MTKPFIPNNYRHARIQQDDAHMFNRMLSLSQSALLTLSDNFRILEATDSIETILGHSAETLIGKIYTDLIAEQFHKAFFTLMAREEVASLDYPLRKTNGVWSWVHHTSEQTETSDGSTCFHVMLQSINQYKAPRSSIEHERNMLRTVIDDLPAAIYARDLEGRYIFSNGAHTRLLNKVRQADVIGEHFSYMLPPKIAEREREEDALIMETGKILQGQHLFLWDENHPNEGVWLDSTKMPMMDSKGNIEGIIGIERDISAQKRAQQLLEVSEERHRILLDAIPDVMFVIRHDGIITEFRSTPAVESLGLDDSIVGMSIEDIDFPKPFIDEALLYLELALETQYIQSFDFTDAAIPLEVINNPLEWRHLQQQYPEINHYEARLITLNKDEVMALVRNITPLKSVQDELRNHIEDLNLVRQVNNELSASLRLNLVAELALDATMRLSGAQAGYLAMAKEDGTLSLMRMVGAYKQGDLNRALLDKQGVLSRVWRTRSPELVRDVSQDADYIGLLDDTQAMIIIPLLSNERIVGLLTLESRRTDRFSDEQFQFLQLITGRIAAFLENASLHETTQAQVEELQKLYNEVSKLEQIKTDMIRVASHDLRTPLTGVIWYLDLLRNEMPDGLSEQAKTYFDKIEEAAQNMGALISGILNLEFIEHLSEQQTLKLVDFTQLVNASTGENMDNAVRKQQTLTIDAPEDPIFLEVDSFQLHQAITNLVSNAIKYTPDKGTIEVRLWESDEMVYFRVKDNGYGIPEDQQKRLFTPFYRAQTEETVSITGTGLGLHLVQNIIERHHGTMYFESTYKVGSTFGFDLPINPYTNLDETQQIGNI